MIERHFALFQYFGRRPHQQGVGATGDRRVFVGVVQPGQEVTHTIKPRPLLVIRCDHRPGGVGGVSVKEHRLFGRRVGIPHIERLNVLDSCEFSG